LERKEPTMEPAVRRHQIIVALMLSCVSIEALTLYPNLTVFVLAVPIGLFGIFRGMHALCA
jgi:hypothetical protein